MVEVENTSPYATDEIIQLYIEALCFSVARPINELKAFKRVHFKPYQKQTIEFNLTIDDFRSYNLDMQFTAEKQQYKVKVGTNAQETLSLLVDVSDL